MAISYPVAFPTVKAPAQVVLRALEVAGHLPSPLNLVAEVHDWGGDGWEADVIVPPLKQRADAAAWVAWLVKLRGVVGSFTMGDPVYTSPRGSWNGASPLFNGAHSAGARTIAIDGLANGATGKEMDMLQVSSGSTARLHMVVADFTANGSGEANVEIWPALRADVANNAAITLASPKGVWKLASNSREWSIERAQVYGLRFACIEDRTF